MLCIQVGSEWSNDSFGKSGKFLDEHDMSAKYKEKPYQLANIFKNARQITCPVRGVTLWEDPSYSTKTEAGTHYKKQQNRTLVQNEHNFVKRQKTKTPKAIVASESVEKPDKKVTPQQLKRAAGIVINIKKESAGAKEFLEKVEAEPELKEWISDKAKKYN